MPLQRHRGSHERDADLQDAHALGHDDEARVARRNLRHETGERVEEARTAGRNRAGRVAARVARACRTCPRDVSWTCPGSASRPRVARTLRVEPRADD